MSGTLLANRKINDVSVLNITLCACRFDILFNVLIFGIFNRMSPPMVACIAVEAISILEKLHMKGWVPLIPFVYFDIFYDT